MFVDPAAAQITRGGDEITHVVLCHHPYSWLKNGIAFRNRVEKVARLHLFGHEHTRRVEEFTRFTTIRAGAVHPDRQEKDWDPGYNWINLSVSREDSERRLDVNIWVRKWEGSRFIAVPNEDRADPWPIQHKLPNWIAPLAPARPDAGAVAPVVMSEPGESSAAQPLAVNGRSVISKLLRLSEHQQRQVIVGLSLDQDGDQALKDYEFVIAAVTRAKERGKLLELDIKADEELGALTGDERKHV